MPRHVGDAIGGSRIRLHRHTSLRRWGVALYGVAVVAVFHTFVTLYEEPTLRATYEEEYDAYCARTPRWIPRVRR